MTANKFQLTEHQGLWRAQLKAMASPCEVLLEGVDQFMAQHLGQIAVDEALRIETTYSRYRDDNIVHAINNARGKSIEVDEETARLLDFASQCYQLSDGLFDISSGVLRKAWRFDGSNRIPAPKQVRQLLSKMGWHKIRWQKPLLTLPQGMQIDFGGIGKEYAVDRTLQLLQQQSDTPILVNFGGDLHASGPRLYDQPWITGIEHPQQPGKPCYALHLRHGAMATSGDAHRYLIHNGKRYSHILNPKTGWPVADGPQSVTVAATNCSEAGVLSTLAMLQGPDAEEFLKAQEVPFWVFRC